ncbi:MAG: nicotinate (nicotinamide) nucleotide adenylyltransferase [Clostridia bacterium]|nr:nicotinate (nicotinamide) nucleotide adenylyltransferase [Clostridia bacterium]
MKIGVFGGSFNPIHKGHINLCEIAAKAAGLDRIILIPAAVSPFKTGYSVSDSDRLQMCRLAVEDLPLFSVSDIELARGGVSYTVDTLALLKKEYPHDELYLIVGADSFLTLDKWKDSGEILRLAAVCTMPREDVGIDELEGYKKKLEALGGRVVIARAKPYDLSSTEVRGLAAHGIDVTPLTGERVAAYIKNNRLYTENNAMERIDEYYAKMDEYTEILRKRLTKKRFEHSVNVCAEAVRLAKKYGCDEKRAAVAGLLHDVMKDTDKEEQLTYMLTHGMGISELELCTPKLWHAMAGACYIQNTLDIYDDDIVNAVRYHTTARGGMSLLEKIVYLADYTSDERDYDGADEMRAAVDIGLEYAMEAALKFSIEDLVARQRAIHIDTVNAYNEVVMIKLKK